MYPSDEHCRNGDLAVWHHRRQGGGRPTDSKQRLAHLETAVLCPGVLGSCSTSAKIPCVQLAAPRCQGRERSSRRAPPDLNQGPADLRSAALTTELCTHLSSSCQGPTRVLVLSVASLRFLFGPLHAHCPSAFAFRRAWVSKNAWPPLWVQSPVEAACCICFFLSLFCFSQKYVSAQAVPRPVSVCISP